MRTQVGIPVKIELHIQLLGGFSLSVDSEVIPADEWKSWRASSLVKLLTLTPGHRLHRDQLADILWSGSNKKAAANNFYQALYIARQVLKKARVPGLILEEGFLSLIDEDSIALTIDVEQFETAAKAVMARMQDTQNLTDYQSALVLYTGELLPNDIYEEWVIQRREALRQTYLNLLLKAAHLQENQHDYPAGIDTLLRLLSVERTHEEAHTGLMRLYALAGQPQQALRHFQTLKEILFEELGVEPIEETVRLYQDIAAGRFRAESPDKAPAQPARPLHNLSRQLTTLIGREEEVARVKKMVSERPLVTLTGEGGVGKTRLAQRVAEEVLDDYTGGVWLVELAPISTSEQVSAEVASTLGLREEPGQPILDRLKGFLSDQKILLVLDNCEHLLDACNRLAEVLLHACPQLKILATCREPLGVAGETIFRVPSLPFPKRDQAVIPEIMEGYAAVRLFIDRASQIRPGYQLTVQNADAVASICQHLDGIPLAIELASARMNVLTAEELAGRLDSVFQLLTGGNRSALLRHQTLRATIDWDYQLLSDRESLLLRRLTAFAGGWDLEGAEGVCAGEGLETSDILDLLAKLVNKSMVVVSSTESGATRYRMLETIRQYAREKLSNHGEEAVVRRRHLTYFVELAERIEPQGRGPHQKEWRRRLKEDIENIRLALGNGLREDPQASLRLASALWHFWKGTIWDMEGARWLRNCLNHPENAAHTSIRGYALSRLSYSLRDILGGEAAAQESLEIFRELNDRLGQGIAQLCWGRSALTRENLLVGREHISAAMDILEEVGDPWWRMETLHQLGTLANYDGDLTTALSYYEKAIAWARVIGNQEKIAWLLHNISVCTALNLGDLRGGYEKMLEVRAIFRQNDLDLDEAYVLFRLAEISCWQGEFERASQAWEEMQNKARLSDYDLAVLAFDLYAGRYICLQGKLEEGIAIMEQTIQRLRESATLNYLLSTQQTFQMELAYAHVCLGEIVQAESLIIEFGPFFLDAQYQPRLKRLLGFLAYQKGEALESAGFYRESIKYSIQMKKRLDALLSLEGYAWALQLNAKPVEAARLLGSASEFRTQIGAQVFPRDRPFYDQVIAELNEKLGKERFASAWEEGQAIEFDLACSRVCVQDDNLNN